MKSIPNQFPPLDPPGASRIAIVIECPHINAATQGMLLTSSEQDFLYKALSKEGIVLDQCFIGSVAQAGAADFNRFDWDGVEVQSGIAQLREDLLKFNPSIVLCLGNAPLHLFKVGNIAPRKTKQKSKDLSSSEETPSSSHGVQGEPATGVTGDTTTALSALSEESPHETTAKKGNFQWPNKVGNWRGSLFESWFLVGDCRICENTRHTCSACGNRPALKCLSTYPPSHVLRDWSLQPYFRFDSMRLAQESRTRKLVVPERRICIVTPNYAPNCYCTQDIFCILASIAGHKHAVAFDIEGHVGNITSIAFSYRHETAWVIPFAHADGTSVWPEEIEAGLWESIKELLENPEVPKIAQNGLYDCFVIAWTLGICVRNFAYDTMVGMFECFAELEKGLAVQTSILTKQPYYKPDRVEEGELKFESDHDFWHYNGLDACVTYECWQRQQELMNEGQKSHYQFNMSLMPALLYMQIRGMKWDGEAAMAAREETIKKVWELQAMVDREVDSAGHAELNLLLFFKAVEQLDEFTFSKLIRDQLCSKTVKTEQPHTEHRWQLMRFDGKKWKRDGKLLGEAELSPIRDTELFTDDTSGYSTFTIGPHLRYDYKPKHTTKLVPFTPTTLEECEPFILESKKSEWKRVKEIWKELNETVSAKRYQHSAEVTGGSSCNSTIGRECKVGFADGKREVEGYENPAQSLEQASMDCVGVGVERERELNEQIPISENSRRVGASDLQPRTESFQPGSASFHDKNDDRCPETNSGQICTETEEERELNEHKINPVSNKQPDFSGGEHEKTETGRYEESCEMRGEGRTAHRESSSSISRRETEALLGELANLLSLSINVGSTQADGDAQWFLYEVCGLDPEFKKVKGAKTDKISTDQDALVRLYANHADIRVLWVLQLRRLRKLCSDLALETDSDGRLRSTFSLVKETGRMAASESPTGKGTNAQALNKDLRYLVKADPGFEMRKRDLEGADNWTVACECAALGDFTMLEDLRFGLKPAQAIAVILEWPELEKADRATLKAKFKENRKELDKWKYPAAKKTIHGTDYGMGVDTMIQGILKESLSELPVNFSEANPLLLSKDQAERLRSLVLRRYPGILRWHDRVKRELIKGKGEIVTSVGHIRRFYGRKKEWSNGQWKVNHSTFKKYLASLPQFVTTYATKKALQNLWYDPENNPGDGSLKAIPAYVVHDSLDTMNRLEDSEWCNKKELEWFNNPIDIAGITVTIPSERAIGSNWGMKD